MGRTKELLKKGETAHGAWITIPHPAIVELLQNMRFDWLALDLEHAPFDNRTIYEMVRASNGHADILARLPSCDPDIAKQVLDAGVNGIIVPCVETPEQAKAVFDMAHYPPDGKRGMGLCRANGYGAGLANYHHKHNEQVITVIMIETLAGARKVDMLAFESRADAILIGPYDLSSSMGIPAQFKNPKFTDAVKAIKGLLGDKCAPGIHVANVDPELVAEYRDDGFQFIACGLDSQMLRFGASNAVYKPCHSPTSK